jgi:glyoxylase-like metal-dependent hydrolase (beta-lactamase superfamily II)
VTDTVAPPAQAGRPPKQEQEPASTEVVEVTPNVLRLQLPISMPGLGHVNTYVLVDDRGMTLMDPGLPGHESFDALVVRLRDVGLSPDDVHTVYVTHSHIDHFGLAPRLARESRHNLELITHEAFGAHWRRSRGEDLILADVDLDDIDDVNPWEGETPWGREWGPPPGAHRIELVRPHPTRYVRDNEPIRLAGREMFIVHSPGHTLDHICLSDPDEGALFSGDHVLPSITPHISGLGSGRDPLDLFEESLVKVGGMDGVQLVLPAHGHPFTDLRGRTEAIRAHHVERLLRLRDLSQDLGPATVEEFSHHLFREANWGPMAEAETFAHLEHLRLAGLAERRGSGGNMAYELAPR